MGHFPGGLPVPKVKREPRVLALPPNEVLSQLQFCRANLSSAASGFDHRVGHFWALRIMAVVPKAIVLSGLSSATWDRSCWGGRRHDQGSASNTLSPTTNVGLSNAYWWNGFRYAASAAPWASLSSGSWVFWSSALQHCLIICLSILSPVSTMC